MFYNNSFFVFDLTLWFLSWDLVFKSANVCMLIPCRTDKIAYRLQILGAICASNWPSNSSIV